MVCSAPLRPSALPARRTGSSSGSTHRVELAVPPHALHLAASRAFSYFDPANRWMVLAQLFYVAVCCLNLGEAAFLT